MKREIRFLTVLLAGTALNQLSACSNSSGSVPPPDAKAPGVHAPFPEPELLENARGLPLADRDDPVPVADLENVPSGVTIRDVTTPVSAAETSDVVLSLMVGPGLYREIAVEFSTPDGQVFERQRRDVGAHRQPAARMKFSMPVSGTWAASPERHGTWNAQVFLDGVAAASRSFEVQP